MAADCRISTKMISSNKTTQREGVQETFRSSMISSNVSSSNYKGTRTLKRTKFSLVFSIIVTLLLYEVTPAFGLFLNCDSVQNCICGKADDDGWRIECPNETRFKYPIELKVQRLDANNYNEAALSIQCDESEQTDPWSYIKAIDLSKSQVEAKFVLLQIKYCPPAKDGWSELFKKLNLTGSDIRRFSFIKDDRSDFAKPVQIPPNFFDNMPNIEILNLRDNKLTSIPDLSNLKKLETINLRGNELRHIPANAFSHSTKLARIALTHNKISEIAPKTFPDSVEHLELNKNEISYLNSSMFSNLVKLKRLYLDSNPLDTINPDSFDGMPALEELLIYNSHMTQFPSLNNLQKLVNLTISTAIRFEFIPGPGDITTTLAPDYLPENTLTLRNLPSLENVKLPLNHFTSLPVFENLPKLALIDLSRNEMSEIESGAFSGLPSLKWLYLGRNRLKKIGTIKASSLLELDVSRNLLTEIQNDTFLFLNSLKRLDLSRNQIAAISYKAFEPLNSLEEINLSNNKVNFASSLYSGSDNVFGDISNQSPLRWSLKLKRLLLSHNEISKLGFSDWAQVFTQINEIDLSYNKIERITANELNFISSNLTLNLENNQISVVDLTLQILLEDNSSESKEERIYLGGNPLECDCQAFLLKKFMSDSYKLKINNISCNSPPELQGKLLTEVSDENFVCDMEKEKGCPEPCTCKERPVDKTVLVNCSSLNLTTEEIPQLNTFRGMYSRIYFFELDLSDNEIVDFNDTNYMKKYFNKTKHVNLSRNKLTSTLFLEKVADYQPTKFSVAKNPFPCSNCKGFQIPWRAFPTRISDLGNVTCRKDRETSYFFPSGDSDSQKFDLIYVQENSKEFEKFCASAKLSVVIIVPLVIAILFLSCLCIILFVTIKYGWTIKAYLYSKGWDWCLFWENDLDAEEDDANEKLYDAFVSYSHKDEGWVVDELVNKLEEHGFKLCLHFRDWTPGDWIPDQIVRSVDKSRRTIVVLSKNFVESVWSRLEFKAAHAQALKERSNRVILILLGEDLKECEVHDDDLKMYMKMNTFMKWNDPLFWHRLKYALPHKKTSASASGPIDDEEKQNVINRMQQRERAIKLDKIRAKWEQNV